MIDATEVFEARRQIQEEQHEKWMVALDDEIERIEASDFEIAEAIARDPLAVALAYASRTEHQAIYDLICDDARANVEQESDV